MENTNNVQNNNQNGNKKEKNNKGVLYGIIVALVVVIIILLMRSCGTTQPTVVQPNDTTGSYEVGDKREEPELPKPVEKDPENITFAGYGTAKVSAERPEIELFNPEKNTVDFVFTLTDAETGEVVVKTEPVAPGKYVYLNVFDYYKNPGSYSVNVNIATYNVESGDQMNGMNQKMTIEVS